MTLHISEQYQCKSWGTAVGLVSFYKIVLECKLLEKLGKRFEISLMLLTLEKYGEEENHYANSKGKYK